MKEFALNKDKFLQNYPTFNKTNFNFSLQKLSSNYIINTTSIDQKDNENFPMDNSLIVEVDDEDYYKNDNIENN